MAVRYDATLPHSIGDLYVRTGVRVPTIRFCSDSGLLPLARRTPAGHRRYSDASVGRLHLHVWTVTDWQVIDGHLPLQPWTTHSLGRP
ncbi:MerR family DNA-binding transcriptional regulator [Streptomyces sp. NPDC049936]|uniref:MerR family DNA-binding transcriptional regulator n=1 Tax=Streptomyces sp. NPDC049936 TaxID=3365599 RepID=UPI0037A907E0